MKKKIFSVVTTLLLSCCFALAQNGGIPVGLKPYNPPSKPPFDYYLRLVIDNQVVNIEQIIIN